MTDLDWRDAFAHPGTAVDVDFVCPEWVGVLTRRRLPEADPASTAGAEVLSVDGSEMSPMAADTWAREGGWAAMRTRFRALAEVLGGEVVLETYEARNETFHLTGTRHCVTYNGEAVEDL